MLVAADDSARANRGLADKEEIEIEVLRKKVA
jgi:hypothetical protein